MSTAYHWQLTSLMHTLLRILKLLYNNRVACFCLTKCNYPLYKWSTLTSPREERHNISRLNVSISGSSLVVQKAESICLQCRRPRFNPWVGKIPWRRKWQPTPVLLPGKFHGLRSLVGYSPWGSSNPNWMFWGLILKFATITSTCINYKGKKGREDINVY